MLNYFQKSQNVAVELLKGEDYTEQIEEITKPIFEVFKNGVADVNGFISLLSNFNYEWVTKPHLICEHLLNEADISINLKCYDNNYIESRA